MKTININGQNFTIEQLNELIEQSKKPQHWTDKLVQPSKEEYFYIEMSLKNCFEVAIFNKSIFKPQHAFATKEQAKLVADKCTLMVEMHNFAHAMNDGWFPDWKNEGQRKYGIIYYQIFCTTFSGSYNDFLFGIAVKSEEIAEQMLKEFKDRLQIYNQQF